MIRTPPVYLSFRVDKRMITDMILAAGRSCNGKVIPDQ